jgi:hypothetical protein
MEWFEKRGITLKIEEDGRIFPVSDDSQSIINCFLHEVERLKIQVFKSQPVQSFQQKNSSWHVKTKNADFSAEKIMLASGSNPKMWKSLKNLGHKIIEPVPSLFTFNIKDERIKDIPGITTEAQVKINHGNFNLESKGPLLITHWGMSGPGILKLSAWGARTLKELDYKFELKVNWLPGTTSEEILTSLKTLKISLAKQQVLKHAQFDLPKRLWKKLGDASKINEDTTWADVNKHQLQNLSEQLTEASFQVHGKSTFKEEFVTAGGVDLKEVDFKTFESKLHKNLFLAGEVLNIDAIT